MAECVYTCLGAYYRNKKVFKHSSYIYIRQQAEEVLRTMFALLSLEESHHWYSYVENNICSYNYLSVWSNYLYQYRNMLASCTPTTHTILFANLNIKQTSRETARYIALLSRHITHMLAKYKLKHRNIHTTRVIPPRCFNSNTPKKKTYNLIERTWCALLRLAVCSIGLLRSVFS